MTKAPTKGEKRRRRKACPLSGVTLTAEPEDTRETVAEITDAAILRRCALMDWLPTDGNRARARDQRLGTLYGRVYLAGMLGRPGASAETQSDAYRGIEALDRLTRQYRRICLDACVPGDGNTWADHDADPRELASRWVMADAALTKAGADVRRAVLFLVDAGEDWRLSAIPPRVALLAALGGLQMARHFGMRT